MLAQRFGTMDALMAADMETLQEIEGIGPELAQSIYTFLHNESGQHTVEGLRRAGVNMTQPKRKAAGPQPFAGKTVVVTGTLEPVQPQGIQTSSASWEARNAAP